MSETTLTLEVLPHRTVTHPGGVVQPAVPWNPLKTNKELATHLGVRKTPSLTWTGKNKSQHYSITRIRKKRGNEYRTILNPDMILRRYQHRILRKILDSFVVPDYIHAFESGRSIPAMAAAHVHKGMVISLDIRKFFDSIHQDLILRFLTEHGIGIKAATTISELCTYKFYLPQGALTSPKLANLITAATFGPPLYKYCSDAGLTLTIYADDITVSSTSFIDVQTVIADITEIVERFGFKINTAKTKVMPRKGRQYVCGTVVNDKVNMLRKDRYELKAIVHNITKNGLAAEATKSGMEPGEFLSYIKGRLNWFNQLNPTLATKQIEKLEAYMQDHPISTLTTPATEMPAMPDSAEEVF